MHGIGQIDLCKCCFVIALLRVVYVGGGVITPPNVQVYDGIDVFGDNVLNSSREIVLNDTRQGKVLNFFPIPVEEECLSSDGRRTGICMNTYECRIQTGTSFGPCALGFGVCCVFKATCEQDIFNNITYFVNPHFPDLTRRITNCPLKIKKIDPEIAQIRLDFIHFTLGQPNRRTGDCEEDVFLLTSGSTKSLKLCGINSGQHVYFDVDDSNDAVVINMTMGRKLTSRLWEIKITQIPFAHRAPTNCLQYHTGPTGIIQTMNFAENGRHLTNQDYNICMRQEVGMCSIAYEPCDENSFKIGPNLDSSVSSGTTSVINTASTNTNTNTNSITPGITNDNSVLTTSVLDQQADESMLEDVGSGDGNIGAGETVAQNRMMELCMDRIMLPCESEDLLMPVDSSGTTGSFGFCDLVHCGNSLCGDGGDGGQSPCRVESIITPFTIGVHFGPSAREAPPDENIGMCLTYEQLPCTV